MILNKMTEKSWVDFRDREAESPFSEWWGRLAVLRVLESEDEVHTGDEKVRGQPGRSNWIVTRKKGDIHPKIRWKRDAVALT